MEIVSRTEDRLKRSFIVRIPVEKVREAENRELLAVAQRMNLKGFRPGKVPVAVAQKQYGSLIKAEVKKDLTSSALTELVQQEKGVAAFDRKTKILKDDENGIELSIEFELTPTVEVKDLPDVKLTKYVVKINDKDVDERFAARKNAAIKYEDITEPAQKEDVVEVDMIPVAKGKKHKYPKFEKISLTVGDDALMDNLGNKIVGLKVGEDVRFSLKYPDNYVEKKLKGKTVEYDVHVYSVQRPGKYESDEDFAKSINFENVEKLKESIREELESENSNIASEILNRDLLDILSAQYDFDVPQAVLDVEYQEVHKTIVQELARLKKKMSPDVEAGCRKLALERVRIGFIISAIAKADNIVVTQEEFDNYVRLMALMSQTQRQQIFAALGTEEGRKTIWGALLEINVLKHLIDKIGYNEKEISREELKAKDEEVFDFVANAEDLEEKSEEKASVEITEKNKSASTSKKTRTTASKKATDTAEEKKSAQKATKTAKQADSATKKKSAAKKEEK